MIVPTSAPNTAWEISGLLFIVWELLTLPYRLVFELEPKAR